MDENLTAAQVSGEDADALLDFIFADGPPQYEWTGDARWKSP